MKRKKYTREFKIEACKLVINHGQTITQTASDLGVGNNMLSRWIKSYKEDPDKAFCANKTSKINTETLDNKQLKDELKRVRIERDILKKAMAYFVDTPG